MALVDPENPYPPAVPRLTEQQRQVLVAACDGVCSALAQEDTEALVRELARDEAHAEAIRSFCRLRASDFGLDGAEDLLARTLTADEAGTLALACNMLGSRVLTMALAWRGRPFAELPEEERRRVLAEWGTSRLELIRRLSNGFRRVAMLVMVTGKGPGGKNPLHDVIRYPGAEAIRAEILRLPPPHESHGPLREARLLPPPGDGVLQLECDCVIVGSGVGGSVVAAKVAQMGYRVLMLEKGDAQDPENLVVGEPAAYMSIYERGGLAFTSEDGVITVAAGSALGGGTALNWFCSLDTPHYVRGEWASQFGLDWAAGDRLSSALEAAKDAFGVHTDGVEHGPCNAALLRGCRRLGYPAEVAPQQGYPGTPGDGGFCGFGYKAGARQGTKGSFLADAAATGHFQVLTRAFAERVLVEGGKAVGVVGRARNRQLEVRARIVVCAGGALQTPLLLKRSGLKNSHIGRNLRLHPVSMMHGLFPEPMELWRGAPMTTVSKVAENLDGRGYGVRLEVPHAHPLVIASQLPWRGDPVEYKRLALQLDRTMLIIALLRDTGSGTVETDERQWPRVTYRVNTVDRRHILEGLCHAARIMVAAGAKELRWQDPELPAYKVTAEGAADPGLDAWLVRLRSCGLVPMKTGLFSAHQMGTCRMAASPRLGAAKPTGETWEVNGLFVSDCSTFPTASGVNPMITCAAIAHLVADNVVARLRAPAEHSRL